ncbi:alcohol dehydrogenase catalytic domain-containing protein [Lactonifactor sp. BIOML-A3]|uniref:zinc-binding alcohol dehydrogenase family protein n=1 Tax=unclassified Lactonifactor TaxID=2636670 RepID=UPI0012B13DEF|nr:MULTISPECIES: zinc-binding alcohol dehydrogenase family protein [unclassified Lactonifactor]MSA03637.1 alcohol dehydrogenase catalytic domain-containing protein [Lactonifactor sp. BIOML-A5]MSA10138.1 alcohol dehydrogenase catalytic domain-containing protein [Lactonifactor sp. BIOML-A4]MSA14644.1 alcohol dehydrogenase catalytic domain-containing protein [Lactonifactor sp. BIOML-A3]MSA19066.1 alcohol dehydrogenase catalytic domain-containing protein [Lactonifactor sp. BIOML-A2]MSA39784.1 alco
MKAIKVIEPFKVEIVDVPKPTIQNPDDVIVRITSGGICGSDIGIYNGTNSLATYPRLIGHEFGGIVTEIGADVMNVKVGDKVAVDPVVSCGHCYACKIGRHNVCRDLEVMGVHRDGGFSEFVSAPAQNVHKFHKDFDESYLGLVEPFTIGVEINNRAQVTKGDKVLIMGSGPIGIAAMQVAKRNGAEVIMTDLVKERLDKALSMGADEVVLVSEENLEDRLMKFTDGEGIPVVVDTVCIPSSFEQSVQLACPAGRIVCIGLKDAPSQITMADITKKELTIVGSRLNNNCFDEVIAGFEDGSLHPEDLMTKAYNYKDIMDALTMIKEHPQDVLKIVLKFED